MLRFLMGAPGVSISIVKNSRFMRRIASNFIIMRRILFVHDIYSHKVQIYEENLITLSISRKKKQNTEGNVIYFPRKKRGARFQNNEKCYPPSIMRFRGGKFF